MEASVSQFLTKSEEEAVVEAIRQAELRTSGEIRVHLEREVKGEALKRAKVLFHKLQMDNTKAENGVLFMSLLKIASSQFVAIAGSTRKYLPTSGSLPKN